MDMRVGTWNVENLFRPGAGFGPANGEVYRAKLDGLAATIDRMAPDVLGLQEVGSPEALEDLVDRLGAGWQTALSLDFDPRHPIRVAFLSRHPMRVVADVRDFPAQLSPVQVTDPDAAGVVSGATRSGRGVLAVEVDPPGGRPLLAACCHLKSKLLSFPPVGGRPRFQPRDEGERARVAAYALARRAAEAVAVRDLATRLLRSGGEDGRTTPVVVLGDLNDEPAAATTQVLYGPPGSQLGSGGFDRPDDGDGLRLFNLSERIPAQQRFTRRFGGRGEMIDHILVSRILVEPLPVVEVVRQVGVDALPDVTTAGPRPATPASDHAAVLAHLTV